MQRNEGMRAAIIAVIALTGVSTPAGAEARSWPWISQTSQWVSLRGKPQELRLYGAPGRTPVIVASGDGGWLHLAPHIATVLRDRGYSIVGFDAKAYLSSFTDGKRSLSVEDVQHDFADLIAFASGNGSRKPILIGVSEGAGLSVLAGADPMLKSRIAGVVGLGLGDVNELAWRWKDSIIYVTKGVPKEPTFSSAAFVARLSPVPLALVQSTTDEFVSREESIRLESLASGPKHLWFVRASDHRFSDNLAEFDERLLEACDWILRQGST